MRRLVVAIALLGALAALLAGCGLKGTLKPNLPPVASIFIQGPVDTVNQNVHLYWFGSDPDGYVTGFDIRFLNPSAPADTQWSFTTKTDSSFSIYTPTGFAAPAFEVRAIDNEGLKSDVAREDFKFSNVPPRVTLQNRLVFPRDTTFASATLQWTASDPDGDGTKMRFRIWLDGNEANASLVAGTSFTLPTSQFLQDGQLLSRPRQVCIQAVDAGGMLSPVDSTHWYVRAPATGGHSPHYGRLLIIDDVPKTYSSNFTADTIYYNTAARNLAPGEYSILQMDFTQPFRSAKDLEQTLKQFETVIWYRGEQSVFSKVLADFGEGIGPYLDAGGRMFIESLNLTEAMSTYGALSPEFVSRYLNSDGVFLFPSAPDSSASWGLSGTGLLHCSTLDDSLLNRRIVVGLRAFRTRDPAQVLISAPAHTFSQDNPFEMAVALDVPQAGGGRLIVDTYPAVSATISVPGFPQRASIVLLKILGRLGLTGP